MNPIDRLLQAFPGAKRSANGTLKAKCPAHDDRRASLGFGQFADGGAWVKCHAGCDKEAVLKAVGMTSKDLQMRTNPPRSGRKSTASVKAFPSLQAALTAAARSTGGKLAGCWAYHDLSGIEVMHIARFDTAPGEKEYRPFHQTDKGWLIADPPGPLPLYRLNQLGSSETVYICEGEKACEAAVTLSLITTTSAHGSQSPGKTDWTPLAGRNVVVLPDADDAGAKYARDVSEILGRLTPPAIVKTLNLPGLPPKGDIVEFIAERAEQTPEALRTEIELLAAQVIVPSSSSNSAQESESAPGPGRSQASALVALLDSNPGVELFHTPGGQDGFATIPVGDHRETWPVNSRAFKNWLSRAFYLANKKTPGSQALSDSINVISGKAMYDGPERQVFVRLAQQNDVIWLDLADDEWRAVEITRSGWRIVSIADMPVRFIRKNGMLPLPEPVRGGSILELRDLVNLPQDDQWILTVAWLVASLRVGRPIPILNVNGEQGSAKSTLSRMVRGLIDPNKAALRSPPRDERDLVIAASNSLIVAFDNLSGLPVSLSDALCRLATGGGFSTRELYSNDGEAIFESLRPVLINGIDDVATRSDALDRCINISLTEIPDDKRRDEAELWAEYERRRPRILGALLDAVSTALRNINTIRLDRKPRMADFALWVAAAEPVLPWGKGQFIAAYSGNRGNAHQLAIEASPVAVPVMALVRKQECWRGTAGELLLELESNHTDDNTRRRKDWPANRKAMANALRRVAPNLRAVGVTVEFSERTVGHEKKRLVTLERRGDNRSRGSAGCPPTIEPAADSTEGADRADDEDEQPGAAWSAPEDVKTRFAGQKRGSADDADRADRHHPLSTNGSQGLDPATPCRQCAQREWWRPHDSITGWTCGVCHPPAPSLRVVWERASRESAT